MYIDMQNGNTSSFLLSFRENVLHLVYIFLQCHFQPYKYVSGIVTVRIVIQPQIDSSSSLQ